MSKDEIGNTIDKMLTETPTPDQPTPPAPPIPPQPIAQPQPPAPVEPPQITPQPQPTPVPQQSAPPMMTATPQPLTTVISPNQPQKKLPLKIISLALVAVLLIGGITWFFAYRQNPTRIVNNSIRKTINSRRTAVVGNMTYSFTDQNSAIKSISIEIQNENKILPSAGSTSLVMIDQNSKEYRLTLSETILKNGDIYIKIDDLKNAYDQLLETMMSEIPAGFEEIITGIETPLTKLIGEIDGQWWRISVSDITEMAEGSDFGDQYGCIVNTVNRSIDNGTMPKEIANIYKKNPFITGKRQSGLYQLSIDEAKINSAMRALNDSQLTRELATCTNTTTGEPDRITIDQADFPEILLNINYFSHRLNSVQINYPDRNQRGFSLSAQFDITHPRNINIQAPDNARPISDLRDIFTELISDLIGSFMFPDNDFDWDQDWGRDSDFDWDFDWDDDWLF